MRLSGEDPIIVDAGDLLFKTKKLNNLSRGSDKFRANAIVKGYEKIGCHAVNIGIQDLSAGVSFLLNLSKKTTIPFLSANIRSAKTKKLLFKPYEIIEKKSVSIGIIGLTSLVPDTLAELIVDNYLKIGRNEIKRIRKSVDIIVLLINSDRQTYDTFSNEFPNADIIFTSGSNFMTRPIMRQNEGGPFIFSTGREGRYLSTVELDIKNNQDPIVNVSYLEQNIKFLKARMERIQNLKDKKMESKKHLQIEEIRAVKKNGFKDIKEGQKRLKRAVNTLRFYNIPMDKKIKDNETMTAFVKESIATCNSLIKKE